MTDPYVLPNGTLRNKLGITDSGALSAAEADVSFARLRRIRTEGPQGPFDFERLKATHHYIFQDVYDWAGKPRTTPLAKRVHEGGPIHRFAEPGDLAERAGEIFGKLARHNELRGLSREQFAERAADLFGQINQLHTFREGNGRTQRAFVEALAKKAGHELHFDVVSRERMIEASIQAGKDGEPAMMRRLFQEISDPERVAPLRKATQFLQAQDYPWNERYIATTTPGQRYAGQVVGAAPPDFMMHNGRQILVGRVADLREAPSSGQQIEFVAGARERAEAFRTLPQEEALQRFPELAGAYRESERKARAMAKVRPGVDQAELQAMARSAMADRLEVGKLPANPTERAPGRDRRGRGIEPE